ncbi:hypothetical protein LEP1GSC047_2861 [Leptospira inadai serovar Lyme str. 10]|uniref:Uncharacterized protein n=2 Tax=Leptospira inadai TaxID=29506 RepID=V6HCX9_9LEPT|nr:hypothetical protein LEP1GSC047_2861 [Leptospira inadai serovar Lyme str. 10]
MESYKKAIQIAPDTPEIVYRLPPAYENSGNKKLALKNYIHFIEIAYTSIETDVSDAKERIRRLSNEEKNSQKGNDHPKNTSIR